ncbi:unnamed protein product, partial [Staurois parvus]
MCNVSTSLQSHSLLFYFLLSLMICVSVFSVCVLGWAASCHSVLSSPIAWGIPAWDLSECGSIILHSLQLSPCHCQPQIQSVRDTDFVFILVLVASHG